MRQGSVSGKSFIGGLVGLNGGGTITNSYATGTVSGSRNDVGGLVGENRGGTITNSYATGTVSGSGNDVGGLVGLNSGTITNSYATGTVTGLGNHDVGGLVGENRGGTITNSYATGTVTGSGIRVGGLVGWHNTGTITNSYATGAVKGSDLNIGGLVGENGGAIMNGYATGTVRGEGARALGFFIFNRLIFSSDAGGLVGYNNGGTIKNSYATGSVSGSNWVGGLVGYNRGGTIMRSYWDSDTSGIAGGRTTGQLQSPGAPGGDPDDIYYDWSDDDWDFGMSDQYPVLKYTDNDNTNSKECRSEGDTPTDLDLPICGSLLSPTLRGLSELQLVQSKLSPDFDVAVPNYRGVAVSSTSTIQFRPITVNPDAKVYITVEGQSRGLAIDSNDESSMISLNPNGITTITVEVENDGKTTQTVIYTLDLYYEFSRDVDRDDDGLIEIDDLETLNAIRYQLDGSQLQLSDVKHQLAA